MSRLIFEILIGSLIKVIQLMLNSTEHESSTANIKTKILKDKDFTLLLNSQMLYISC